MSNATGNLTVAAEDIKLVFNMHEVNLLVDWQSGIGGGDWPAARLFCEIVTHDTFWENVFENKKVIELGSGTGLGGILVDKVFTPSEVVITYKHCLFG